MLCAIGIVSSSLQLIPNVSYDPNVSYVLELRFGRRLETGYLPYRGDSPPSHSHIANRLETVGGLFPPGSLAAPYPMGPWTHSAERP